MGEVWIHQEKDEKAYASFEMALQTLSANSLWHGLTHLELGNLQRRWGRIEEAKKSFRIVYDQSRDEHVKRVAKKLLEQTETR